MGLRRHRDTAGASLPNRLMILLAVPLLAVGVATTIQALEQRQIVHKAQTVERFVEDVIAVDGARLGTERGIVPSLAARRYKQMSASSDPKIRQQAIFFRAIASEVPAARAAADAEFTRAIAASADAYTAGRLRAIHRRLVALRTSGDGLPAYASWSALETDLDGLETSLLYRATVSGVDVRLSQALNDVSTVAPAAQYGGQLAAALISTFAAGSAQEVKAGRAEFAKTLGAYQTSSERVLANTSSPVRKAWAAATGTAGSQQVDRIMVSAVAATGGADPRILPVLGKLALPRQTAFNAVLQTSLDRAAQAATRAQDNAQRNVAWVIALDALLLAITVGLALLVRAWVSRSLNRLAVQAGQISEGQLPDVQVTGPKEVRTVARALAASVATLRNVQKQAEALADGTIDDAAVTSTPVGPLGQVVHASIVRVLDAMRSQRLAQEELAHRAAHDLLTELPNRGYVVDLLNRSLHRAQRSGAMTGLLFIDLDHFKTINDTFGHAAGDFVLQTAAHRMSQAVREGDVVARLGGDEFVVLLEDLSSETRFVQLADRLVDTLREPMIFEGRTLRIGASVGVAICRDGAVDGDRLMREADAAVYRAKADGRNRVGIFDEELRRELSAHAELEAALHDAVAQEQFVVHYQPVVDISTGAATGMEALIRWDRPGVGVVAPNDFIPVAESSTLINDIGRYVLGEATRQLAEWTERDPSAAHLTMAVNISGRHLSSSQLVEDVADALARSGVAPERLVIELTETMLVDNAKCSANMHALRRLGVKIALDDFGTGYTSIGQLQQLPIDMLKIDRSFVSSGDPSRLELCKLMVSAGRALGLDVIAEGVETEDQADALRHLHVQSGQGFLYARPQAAGDLDTEQLMRPEPVGPVAADVQAPVVISPVS